MDLFAANLIKVKAQQQTVIDYERSTFVEACPGAGKTRTIVERLKRKGSTLAPRLGIAILSFTNAAVDEFKERCSINGISNTLTHPSFIGTFDRFISHFLVLPYGMPETKLKIKIVESWNDYNIGPFPRRKARPLPKVSLSSFALSEDGMKLELNKVEVTIRTIVSENSELYEKMATRLWTVLYDQGILSTIESRMIALSNINDLTIGTSLAKNIKARFSEIIVDEAQDCNETDLEIISWLKKNGIQILLVADPAQAIYEFREGGTSKKLKEIVHSIGKLPIDGNFRSSAHICSLAATMRAKCTPDLAVGENSSLNNTIKIISYKQRQEPYVGEKFLSLLAISKISKKKSIILSHRRKTAFKVAGNELKEQNGSSILAEFAYRFSQYQWSSPDNRSKARNINKISLWILAFEGNLNSNEQLDAALERLEIPTREMRRKTIDFLEGLPISLNKGIGNIDWLTKLRENADSHLTIPSGKSVNSLLQNRNLDKSLKPLMNRHFEQLNSSTVHNAKGREYDAVCLTIPHTSSAHPDVIDLWELRDDQESLRVLYVGATRARKLLCLGIPEPKIEQVTKIMNTHNLKFEITSAK